MKKSLSHFIIFLSNTSLILAGMLLFSSCEDVIDLDIPAGESQLVVDGWITNQPKTQTIRLTQSAPFFDNTPARPVLGASVTVTDDRGKTFVFKDEKNNGTYLWQPATPRDTLGRIGGTYRLLIKTANEEYSATSRLNRVPRIDSLNFFPDEVPINPPDGSPRQGFTAEFFARDPVGVGDCYWIKSYRNDTLFNRTNQIVLAFDAGFSPGAATDGLQFILPIRRSITQRFFQENERVRVEIHSIGLEGFFFLNQVRQESNNAGLFATIPANIPTNIQNRDPKGRKALGYFGASAVSSAEVVIDRKKAKPKP
ncbi:MAG: DUF4249 domain-containing protein [Runella sp.]